MTISQVKYDSSNKCIGDDTKAAARRSPKCSRKTKNTAKTIFNMAAVRHLEYQETNNGFFQKPCGNARNRIRAYQDHSWTFSVRLLQSLRLVHQLHFGTLGG